MTDPAGITVATADRAAAALLDSPPALDTVIEAAHVQNFVMRTGRPLPQVIVLGSAMALRCAQIEMASGAATGVNPAPNAIELARRQLPGGNFVQGDMRDLPLDVNFYDGAWAERVPARLPRTEIPAALSSIHRALRPGGLLYVRLPLGEGEGFVDTPHGQKYLCRWDADEFAQAVGALDFMLLESWSLPDNELGMMFRREY